MAIKIKNLFKLMAILLVALPCLLSAQEAELPVISSERIEHIADSIFNRYLIKGRRLSTDGEHIGIQGGVVSVVSRDSVILGKAYGMANLDTKERFHWTETKVMIASVSKLLTMTVVLKLVEEHRLDFDAPVNTYLPDLEFKNPYDTPITLRHLLTHTAGFDDISIGSLAHSETEVDPLAAHITAHMQPVIWPPGALYNYSNFSFTLLAYIIQEVSGQPFDQYITDKVLKPIGMSNTGFGYSDKLMNGLMQRYRWKDDGQGWDLIDVPVKYTNRVGAGGSKTTGEDMSKFMMFWLKQTGDVLSKESMRAAMQTQFTYDPAMPFQIGWAWNLSTHANGYEIAEHSGDDRGIESQLVLLPKEGLGIFLSFNNGDGGPVKARFMHTFYKALPNKNKEGVGAGPALIPHLTIERSLEGLYQYTNDSRTTIEAISFLFGNGLRTVRVTGDNQLETEGKEYDLVGDNLYKATDNSGYRKFIETDGKLFFSGSRGTYVKLAWLQDPSLHVKVIMGSLVLMFTALAWPVMILIKKLRKRENTKIYSKRWLIYVASFSLIAYAVSIGIMGDSLQVTYDLPLSFKATFVFPVLSIVFFILSLIYWVKNLKTPSLKLGMKVYFGLLHMAVLLFLMVLNHYNLVGFNF